MKQEQTTIKDIARELGISISTVSRALADNPVVKASTRAAIKELASKKNYHPNFTALSLKNRQTKTIGLLIPQVVHEFFSQVIRGIEDVAYNNGYSVIICTSNDSYERERKNAIELLNGRIDGLLACITKNSHDISHLLEYKNRDIPLVCFDCTSTELETDKVIIDDRDAGYSATKHLIDIGCRKVAFIGGPSSLLINRLRFEGFQSAMGEHGLCTVEKWVVQCESPEYQDGVQSSKALFENATDYPDGVFATTDMLAIGAMKNIKSAGLQIPDDVAVIGFSNWEISQIYEPSLSTIDQKGYDIGGHAIVKLIMRIQSGTDSPYETEIIATELVARESTNRKKK